MNDEYSVSISFQKICAGDFQASTKYRENSIAFCLGVFLRHQLWILLDDGQFISGIMTSVSFDFIGINGHTYSFTECSRWLRGCEVGVVIGVEPDNELIQIIPGRYYGIDHRKIVYTNLGKQRFVDWDSFTISAGALEDVQDAREYPVLYGLNGETVDIYCVGAPNAKIYFGSLEKYYKNVGAGLIMHNQNNGLSGVLSLRFAAEDLMNVMPKELDTFSYHYEVSYSMGFLVDGSPKAMNIYKLRDVPLRWDDLSDPLQPLYDRMKEAASQWNASTEILTLEPLPEDSRYGILFFYKQEFDYIKLHCLYKNKIYGELTSVEEKMVQLAVIPHTEENRFSMETLNTIEYVYLVIFDMDNQIQIAAAYEKKEVWMIQLEGEHLLIVRAPWYREQAELERPESSEDALPTSQMDYNEVFVCRLPDIIKSGEVYAILHHYTKYDKIVYFHSIYDPKKKAEQARQCTVARVEQGKASFLWDGEENATEFPPVLNTYKNLYVVRIMPEVRMGIQGAPFVAGAVHIVRAIPRKGCQRLDIKGNSMWVYGMENESIIQLGVLPENQKLPAFIEGETLLVIDKRGQHTVVFHNEDPFIPGEQDIVYRFGLLTDLFKGVDDAELTGGCLNHCIYFDIANMGEQVRNIIQTTPQRILLQYACTDGKIIVERVLPESVWDIPWQKGTVTDCTSSAAESVITVDNRICHYRSIVTDGYVNSAIKSGTLMNDSVYVKKISCPDWQDREAPQLMEIAPLIHCEQEKAAILYDNNRKQYYACRYNLSTNILGTIRRVLYGSERALADAVGQHVHILFRPYGDGSQELIAVLPLEGEKEPDDMRMPLNVSESQPTKLSKLSLMVHQQAEKTGIGFFMLQNAAGKRRYQEILSAIYTQQSSDSQRFFGLESIILSENSEDLAVAAKLLENPEARLHAHLIIQDKFPLNIHSLLRRAMRHRIAEVVQSGSYLVGEFIAYMLAILDSDTTPEQRARDLFVYFMPVFQQRYNMQENALFNIRQPSFSSEKDVLEQEFVVKLREWFCADLFMADASALLAQIVALDDTSFEYLFDITSDAFSRKIREVLLLSCRASESALDMDSLLVVLRRERGRYFEWKRKCQHLLNVFTQRDDANKICTNIAERQQEMFDESFLALLDNDDRENVREILKICQNVKRSLKGKYAQKMLLLEEAEKSISRQKLRISQHPTLIMIELFHNNGLLERVHEEILQTINEICQSADTLPDVRCRCDYPILVPDQSNFALLLENGEKGDEAHRPIRNPVVSLISKGGISEDDIVHELKPAKNELISGSHETITVKIASEDLDVGTIIRIGYTVNYQYLERVSFDESHTYMIPLWTNSAVEGEITLHVEEIPDRLRSDKKSAPNPYSSMVNSSLTADNKMYFGRKDEQNELMKYLMDGQKGLAGGKTVIVYGQKQCGKTSFINRIRKELESSPRAFVLYYNDIYYNICRNSVDALAVFMQKFYGDLLEKLVEKLQQCENQDLHAIAEDCDDYFRLFDDDLLHEYLEEKTRLFFRLIKDIQNIGSGQYKIVLIMDEFTRFCNIIWNCSDLHPEYKRIPEFLRSFSEMGFVQIVVGHNSMMQTLGELNILNRTAQIAKVMQLSALKDEDAEKMILEPMKEIFGFDIYITESGKAAIRKLMVLSGCVPNYLVYLCDKMFRYYQLEKKPQINEQDVNGMLEKFAAADLTDNYKYLFDPLLAEDYDTGDTRGDIERYLIHIARLAEHSDGYKCAINHPCGELGEERSKSIQNMLILRRVLTAEDGKIWINVGLFREHVKMRYGE